MRAKILAFLKSHVWYLVVAVLALVAGWELHRPQIKTVEVSVEAEQKHQNTTIVQKVDLDELKKFVLDTIQNERKNVVTQKTTVKKPDGEVTETETSVDRSETNTETHQESSDQVVAAITQQLHLIRDDLKIHEVKIEKVPVEAPVWKLSLGVGYYVPGLLGASQPANLVPVPGLIVQVGVERHLIGPLSVEAWAQSTGTAGVALKVGL